MSSLKLKSFFKLLIESTLNSYSSILFIDKKIYGTIILLLTFIKPDLGIGGLTAALSANLLAITFNYPKELVRTGLYGISPLLVGISIPFFSPLDITALFFIIPAAWVTMLISVVMNDIIYSRYRIGTLSLSFALIASILGYILKSESYVPLSFETDPVNIFFMSLGAIFFIPKVSLGVLLFILLGLYSRINLALSVLGFSSGTIFYICLGGTFEEIVFGMVGLNFILTAIAIGGFFLESGKYATLHSTLATITTAFVSIVLIKFMSKFQLPVFSLPFNLVTIVWIAGLSMRQKNEMPSLNYFVYGSPENTIRRKFLENKIATSSETLRLPFVGEWTVTQSSNSTPTHKHPWEYAVDFEILDPDGFPFRQIVLENKTKANKEDYYSFGVPVLAAEDGIVVSATASIEDNEPGETNIENSFGNYVIIKHKSLYSVYAHLKQHSLNVAAGMNVRAGQMIARSGSSGRAPRPHLHFQVQASSEIGAPTIPFCFSNLLVRKVEAQSSSPYTSIFFKKYFPENFERVSSIESSAQAFGIELPRHEVWKFETENAKHETWTLEEDLFGGIKISSSKGNSTAVWRSERNGLTAVSYDSKDTVTMPLLYSFFLAASSIPSKAVSPMKWTDERLDYKSFSIKQFLEEMLIPFFGITPKKAEYSLTKETLGNETMIILEYNYEKTKIRIVWDSNSSVSSIEQIDKSGNKTTAKRIRL